MRYKGRSVLRVGLLVGLVVAVVVYLSDPGIPDMVEVSVPLADAVIRPAVATGRLPKSDSFDEMIARLHPYAAINGTFYDTARMEPLGDIVVDGKVVNRGIYRSAIAVKDDGSIVFIRASDRSFDWTGYRAAMAAGPMLVRQGRIVLDPADDGLSTHILAGRARRSGIGITKDGMLILVVVKDEITLERFAEIMLDMNAADAMNLDGGGACGLYGRGKVLVRPTLRMTNLLTVFKSGAR